MATWYETVRIADIKNKDVSWNEKAKQLAKRFRATNAYTLDSSIKSTLDKMSKVKTHEALVRHMSDVYDWADFNRVWVDSSE